MMRRSLESSHPMIPKRDANRRASTRFSTYSSTTAGSGFTEKGPVSGMNNSSDNHANSEISKYKSGVDRMESKRLQDQRYVPSSEKDEVMDKLALAGKVQKALDRRLSSQDAEWKPKTKKKVFGEKSG